MESNERPPARRFIPALRFHALTRLYDPLLRITLRGEAFKRRLVDQAAIDAGHRVLDLGCGTATLTLLVVREQPGAEVVGLDADPKILRIARRKAEAASAAIDFVEGTATAPPLEEGSFDRVISSLLFHHLTAEDKGRALAAARALLRPGGELHVADWGKPHGPFMRLAFLMVQLLDGFATTRDNVRGRLPALMEEAGFAEVAETHRERTLFGTLALYRALAP